MPDLTTRLRNWLQPRLLALIDRDAFERAAKYDKYATQMLMLGADPDEGLRREIWMQQVMTGDATKWRRK